MCVCKNIYTELLGFRKKELYKILIVPVLCPLWIQLENVSVHTLLYKLLRNYNIPTLHAITQLAVCLRVCVCVRVRSCVIIIWSSVFVRLISYLWTTVYPHRNKSRVCVSFCGCVDRFLFNTIVVRSLLNCEDILESVWQGDRECILSGSVLTAIVSKCVYECVCLWLNKSLSMSFLQCCAAVLWLQRGEKILEEERMSRG